MQANLKMDSLRCRAYTRLALRQQNKEVEAMEKEVVETSQRFLVINGENEKCALRPGKYNIHLSLMRRVSYFLLTSPSLYVFMCARRMFRIE